MLIFGTWALKERNWKFLGVLQMLTRVLYLFLIIQYVFYGISLPHTQTNTGMCANAHTH